MPKKQTKAQPGWRLAALPLGILVLGLLVSIDVVLRQDRGMRQHLLDDARLVARAIPADDVRQLLVESPDNFQQNNRLLEAQLAAVVRVHPSWSRIYLMGRHADGSIFFQADSDAGKAEASLPPVLGDAELSPHLHQVFDLKMATTTGPIHDRQGNRVSAFMPLNCPRTGQLATVVGIDIETGRWRWLALREGIPPLGLSFLLAVIVVFSNRMRNGHAPQTGPSRGRRMEGLIACAVGLVLTAAAVWFAHSVESQVLARSFSTLAIIKTHSVQDAFQDIQDAGLQSLKLLVESGGDMTATEFERYTSRLPASHWIQAWGWLDDAGSPAPQKPMQFMTTTDGSPLSSRSGELDPAGVALLRPLLDQARATGATVATPLGPSPFDPENAPAVILVLQAVQRDPPSPAGHVFGVLDPAKVLDTVRIAHRHEPRFMVVELLELEPGAPPQHLASSRATLSGESERPPRLREQWLQVCPVLAFGRTYALTARPTPDFFRLHSHPIRWILLLAGLVITFVVSLFIHLLAYRREDMEQLVNQRTAELARLARENKKAAERYATLISASNTAAWEYHLTHGLQWVSPEYYSMLGFHRETFIAEHGPPSFDNLWIGLIHPVDRENALFTFQHYLDNPAGMNEQTFRLRCADGSWRWILSRSRMLREEDGTASQTILGIHIDITESQQAAEALQESERRFRMLTENMKDVVWTLDTQTMCFTYISPSIEQLSGYTPDEMLSMSIADLLPPEEGKHILDKIRKGIEDFRSGHITHEAFEVMEMPHPCKNGSMLATEAITRFWLNKNTGRIELHGVTRDITQRLHDQKEKEHLQSQLLQSQKMESIGRLAGGIAHDFNNMLQAILGYVEMALEQVPDDQPLHGDLQEIQKAAHRSVALTRQLQAFARKQPVSPQILDLNEAIGNMTGMLRPLIGEHIEWVWKPGPQVGPVKIDPGHLDQLVTNLVLNARDAVGAAGIIQVETKNVAVNQTIQNLYGDILPGGYVRLSISDNGHGMNPDVQSHIFEPFYTTKPAGKGTGLGLATVFGIVGQNGAGIRVISEVGKGTRFLLYFPIQQAISPPVSSPPMAAADLTACRGTETILIVEDELSLLQTATRILSPLGYTVRPTLSPQEALEIAGDPANPMDLLLTDIMMPEMNGTLLVQRIRDLRPDLKFIYMSGYAEYLIADQGIQIRPENLISKPFSRQELAGKVRAVLDAPPPVSAPPA